MEYHTSVRFRQRSAVRRGRIERTTRPIMTSRSPLVSTTATAILHTTAGDIRLNLYGDQAPKTVRNFTELASGSREWTNPATRAKTTEPLYDGTIFHRVIRNFMIQGGDPLGQGYGGPGYKFGDEFHPSRRHDKAGILSMANAGPNTNGSQFFITLGPTPHLDNRHSVFGEVVSGMDVVTRIGSVATGRQDRPVNDVVIESVNIERVPATS